MWGSYAHHLRREMRQWPRGMRAAWLGCKRHSSSTVDGYFRCDGYPGATLIARWALVPHCRSNVLFFVHKRRVPHARAVCDALWFLPDVLRNQILRYLRAPQVLPLKAWVRRRHPGFREALWFPAHPLKESWHKIQRHLHLAAAQPGGTPPRAAKKKPRLS